MKCFVTDGRNVQIERELSGVLMPAGAWGNISLPPEQV
jgi:hypothetical protein